MANSIKAQEQRRTFKDVSISYNLLAATDPDRTPLIAAPSNAKKTIYIQRIAVFVSTSAAQAITFASSATTAIVGVLGASAPIGENVVLDSEEGIALPAGEGLNVSGSAGVAGNIVVEGYERLTPGAVLLPSQL